jgi:hypothetical protein
MRDARWVRLAALTLAAMVLGAPGARADSYWELEHARANARAGGPVSERDAELLERYGCLSGTRNPYCERVRHKSKALLGGERKKERE